MSSERHSARVWEEDIVIPTYLTGAPNKNPMFLEKRVYQGSSGRVYPFPVVDKIVEGRVDKTYRGVFLENAYLKILLLPELGGRVQMALDKTNDYHFVYYNRVIKPALVGLAGPWISGGIEFNWPQHHRPSTFHRIAHHIEACADGSAVVWMSETDRMLGTRSVAGFRLYPDRAILEIDVRLSNPTELPQTFLWWANPAVQVNEEYQSIFPPDVHAVYDHGRRDVSTFPIATGTYYKVDYSAGVDITRYTNIPVPMSYMAYKSNHDFVGGYDHGRQAGMLHVANHHLSPGKKQWTWGCGDFGKAWDRNLTDEDGPYFELMCGVFTDNQPDFSWLQPDEEKRFVQRFMPYKGIGIVKNANEHAAVSLECSGNLAEIGVYVTSPQHGLSVRLLSRGAVIHVEAIDLDPAACYTRSVPLPKGVTPDGLCLVVSDDSGKELIRWQPEKDDPEPLPEPASPPPPPGEVASTEALYLIGLHLEQYRHATFAPEDYYREALWRDPEDIRCNNALGLLLYRRGAFGAAEHHFRAAIKTLTRHNANPYDGEPYYNLGLTLRRLDRNAEAEAAFYKATWNAAWQASAFRALAELAALHCDWREAARLADESLARQQQNPRARHIKAIALRHLDAIENARREVSQMLECDPVQLGALWEEHRLDGTSLKRFRDAAFDSPHNYIALSADYAACGCWEDAATVLNLYAESEATPDSTLLYHLAHAQRKLGDLARAEATSRQAQDVDPGPWFPNRLDSMSILAEAARLDASDARAPYLLGNLLYDKGRGEDAIHAWEQSREREDSFATVHRNLALAYYNKRRDSAAALASMEKAYALDPMDSRVLFELDQLHKRMTRPCAERLAFLEERIAVVMDRDDLYIEFITLLNMAERHDEALQRVLSRRFHPWEGGEGKPPRQYVESRLGLALQRMQQENWQAALEHLDAARVYPENLGEGKLPGAAENDIDFYQGLALNGLGRSAEVESMLRRAAEGDAEPVSAVFYNDQPPDMVYYRGRALGALGESAAAHARFQRLVAFGTQHLDDTVKMDYFAVSLPDFLIFDDDLSECNRTHCLYMIALGYAGLGDREAAACAFEEVIARDPNHQGALKHAKALDRS
jgi:tetratricopeptide (TPR) repeat protein